MKKVKSPKAKALKPKRSKVRKSVVATDEVKKLLSHKNEGRFLLSIKMGEDVFTTKADSIGEALANFRPEKITTKVVLSVEDENGRKIERYVFPHQMRRLVHNPIAMQYLVKNLELMFN